MRKILALALLAILSFSIPSFADVGCYNNGSYNTSTGMFQGANHCGPTTDINYESQTGSAQNTAVGMIRSIPVVDQNLFAAGVAQGDYTSIPSTTAAIPVGFNYVKLAITANGDPLYTAKTLANGYPGQILVVHVVAISSNNGQSGGNATITPTLSTGWSTVKLSAVNDIISLMWVDSKIGWIIFSYDPGASSSITITDLGGV